MNQTYLCTCCLNTQFLYLYLHTENIEIYDECLMICTNDWININKWCANGILIGIAVWIWNYMWLRSYHCLSLLHCCQARSIIICSHFDGYQLYIWSISFINFWTCIMNTFILTKQKSYNKHNCLSLSIQTMYFANPYHSLQFSNTQSIIQEDILISMIHNHLFWILHQNYNQIVNMIENILYNCMLCTVVGYVDHTQFLYLYWYTDIYGEY